MVAAALETGGTELDFSTPPSNYKSSPTAVKVASVPEQDACCFPDESHFIPRPREGVCCNIGSRSYMEDRHVCVVDISEQLQAHGHSCSASETGSFFAVLDGHGGESAADYVRDHLLGCILQQSSFTESVQTALHDGFLKTDADFESVAEEIDDRESGTTALALLLLGRSLHVANTGDCRAVLCRRGRAIALSTDQKPNTEAEMQRIKAAGGYVDIEGMVNGQLSVSRALGDFFLKSCVPVLDQTGPLTAIPEYEKFELSKEDEFLIVASDGLWDVFSNQSAVDLARGQLREHNEPQQCATELVNEAIRRNRTYNLKGDNVSVIVVCLNDDRPMSRECPVEDPSVVKRTVSRLGLNTLQVAMESLE